MADSTPFSGNYLSGEGSGLPMSGYTYSPGYEDAVNLVNFLNELMRGIDYLVPIPYYVFKTPKGITTPREYWRGIAYLEGWIDGASSEGNSNMKGFYWDLETPVQAHNGTYITIDEIRAIWGRILENKREYNKNFIFVWVPALGNRSFTQLKEYEKDIASVAEFFDYVFFQPNYYQCSTCSIRDLQEKYEWIHHFSETYKQAHVEFEADKSVLRIPENCGCGTGYCCISKACDYIIVGKQYPNIISPRAYYFSTDIRVIDKVREVCFEW
ncbi:hypothetical protein [Thermococcus prieurii]